MGDIVVFHVLELGACTVLTESAILKKRVQAQVSVSDIILVSIKQTG